MTRTRTVGTLPQLAVVAVVALCAGGCSSSSSGSPPGDAGRGRDARPDAVHPADARRHGDAAHDASRKADAAHDVSRKADAGRDATTSDARVVMDASFSWLDAGSTVEGGSASDAPSGVDGSAFEDALRPAEAGSDAVAARDATSPDAVAPPDGASSPDAAAPPDASAQPIALVTGLTSPFGLALTDTTLYWTDQSTGALMKVSKNGGPAHWVATNQDNPGIVVVTDAVYWLARSPTSALNQVMRMPLDGGTATTMVPEVRGTGIAVDTKNLYYEAFAGWELTAASLSGDASVPLATVLGNLGAVLVDSTSVYWIAVSRASVMQAPLVPVDGGVPTVLGTGYGPAAALAVDAINVYWNDSISGLMQAPKVPVDGGTPTTLVPWGTYSETSNIATDGISVYWVDILHGAVMKVPVGGGTPVTLASSQSPVNLAVDDTSVYWVNGCQPAAYSSTYCEIGAGSVMKLTPK